MAALTASCIDLNIQGNGAYSVLKQLATIALQNGFITDSHQFLQTLLLREKMHSTGFGSGVAVPQSGEEDQVKIIGTLCRKIIHKEFIHQLQQGDTDQVLVLLNQTLSS